MNKIQNNQIKKNLLVLLALATVIVLVTCILANSADEIIGDNDNIQSNSAIEAKDYSGDEALLLDRIGGSNISILGDSVSTYCLRSDSWSNNPLYNTTIASNDVWYNSTNCIHSVDETYWKRIIDRFKLNLVVNNSYSGGFLMDSTWGDAGFIRAEQLYADCDGMNPKGTIPDIVIIFLGSNDFFANRHLGSIEDVNLDNYKGNSDGTFDYDHNIISFVDAYAYTISKINQLYDEPDIFLLTIISNGVRPDSMFGDARIKYNDGIKSVAEMFDNVAVVDLDVDSPYINDHYYNYYSDGTAHPNEAGMEYIAERIRTTFVEYYFGREPY